jgi:hypothetical protein
MESASKIIQQEDLKSPDMDPVPEADGGVEEVDIDENMVIGDNQYILQYGPKTIDYIMKAIDQSFKLFWDGSISMNIDTVLSSKNNKDALNTLLEMRTRTDEHEDPPITLLHGKETEQVLRTTLMRIKVEQEEAAEANRRAKEAAANNQEDDSDDMAG